MVLLSLVDAQQYDIISATEAFLIEDISKQKIDYPICQTTIKKND